MTVCTACGGTMIEYDPAAGSSFCGSCGIVIEESAIINEITFGETSGGAAMVHGAYVGAGSTGARLGGRYGNRGTGESREQTIQAANEKIDRLAALLRIAANVVISAKNIYKLALEHKFTKGRKTMHVVAVCLYVACRQQDANLMLIDFSDELQVNVFELGHIYLVLVQTLNLKLRYLDPSHYISRFASLLEFGDETLKVASDAVRLVHRFNRDWMTHGRRPAGICGAALLLAARMNNFRRSVEEIVQVVKIADVTLKKRLEEFKNTPSGQLTVSDFRSVTLDEEMDPPSFTHGKEKELASDEEEEPKKKKKGKGRKKRKRGETEEPEEPEPEPQAKKLVDPAVFSQGIFANNDSLPLFLPDDHEDESYLDPSLRASTSGMTLAGEKIDGMNEKRDELEEKVDAVLTEEVESFLTNEQGAQLTEVLDDAERRRLAGIVAEDELAGLDEEELDRFICTPDEVKLKERVWVELNREYLEALAAKGDIDQSDINSKSRKKRKSNKGNNKPRDASTPSGSTAAEAVQNMLKKNPRYSKRINYNALKDLLDSGSATGRPLEGDDLYTMEDKEEDGDVTVVIEDDMDKTDKTDEQLMEEDEDDYGVDKEEGYSGWEEGYEQEV